MDQADLERLKEEVAYYRRSLEELAAERLRLDQRLWTQAREAKQRRQGFRLLAKLAGEIGGHAELSPMLHLAVSEINASLGMDRTVALTPADGSGRYRVEHCAGFGEDHAGSLRKADIQLAVPLVEGEDFLLVGGRDDPDQDSAMLRELLGLAAFAAVPVVDDGVVLGVLVTGRMREDRMLFPALDRGDVDTLQAIATLIKAALLMTKVSALAETSRLKGEFFANISHEFRTPITLTLGPLEQALTGRYGPVSEVIRSHIEMAVRHQDRLLGLVNQLLDLARLEAGSAPLRAAPVEDINRWIADQTTLFRLQAESRGITLRLSLDPSIEPHELYLDLGRFDRLLTNLLSNALKFTDHGHIQISTRVMGEAFVVEVADTGIGISARALPHIFERFQQADMSSTRAFQGSGIGLALVKEIAAMHRGEVSVRSSVGSGSTFTVTLPLGSGHLEPSEIVEVETRPTAITDAERLSVLVPAMGADQIPAFNEEMETGFDPARPTLLLTEDEPDLRRYVRSLLLDEYNVYVAADGADGLEKATRYRPDVIVTDEMMPNMSGREFLRALRAHPDFVHTPVVFLTAVAGTEARVASLDAGADDYLGKPFNEAELRARVRNTLRARTQARELAALNEQLESRIEEQMGELVRTGRLRRYIAGPIVDELLHGADDVVPMRRQRVTVLFADLVGFTELADALEPEDMATLLRQYVREMTAIAIKHGGTVDNVIGDAVMVLFGAPVQTDDAQQASGAIEAALEMRDKARGLAVEIRRRGISADVRIRVGVNAGYCSVGTIGTDELRKFTVLGLPVNIAQRLQGAARPGAILCGFSVHAHTSERVQMIHRPGLKLKGIARPIDAYEVPSEDEPVIPDGTVVAGTRVLKREGEFWTIAFDDTVSRIKDMKGMQHLARLLAQPRQEVHALELSGAAALVGVDGKGDALLDPEAKRAYKDRIEHLRGEADEARAWNDDERAAKLEAEIAELTDALAGALGLAGRDRTAATNNERARVNVTRAIQTAIGRIEQQNPVLGAHLSVSVRTGVYCCYEPDPGVPSQWVVSG